MKPMKRSVSLKSKFTRPPSPYYGKVINHFNPACRKLAAKMEQISKVKGAGDAAAKDGLQYELCLQSGSNKPSQFSRLSELENRIKLLEGVLGSDQKEKLVN